MPDDMLEDSINIAKKTLEEHDFETDGVEVGSYFKCEEELLLRPLKLMIILCRSQRR
jgi:hypothetical protein